MTGPDVVLPYRGQGVPLTTFPRTIRDSDVVSPSRMIAQGGAENCSLFGVI